MWWTPRTHPHMFMRAALHAWALLHTLRAKSRPPQKKIDRLTDHSSDHQTDRPTDLLNDCICDRPTGRTNRHRSDSPNDCASDRPSVCLFVSPSVCPPARRGSLPRGAAATGPKCPRAAGEFVEPIWPRLPRWPRGPVEQSSEAIIIMLFLCLLGVLCCCFVFAFVWFSCCLFVLFVCVVVVFVYGCVFVCFCC